MNLSLFELYLKFMKWCILFYFIWIYD